VYGLFYECKFLTIEETNKKKEKKKKKKEVSVQLVKQFQGRRFLEIDQSETRIACGSHVC
jgi:hypothetical protein